MPATESEREEFYSKNDAPQEVCDASVSKIF